MATQTRFHHRPFPRTAYLLGRPASVWIDAISRQPATEDLHQEQYRHGI
jgi:hypothetical protein